MGFPISVAAQVSRGHPVLVASLEIVPEDFRASPVPDALVVRLGPVKNVQSAVV